MKQATGIATAFLAIRRELERAVSRIVGPADIEDIVQETFVKSFEAGQQREIRHPKAFMLKTARHLALNFVGRSEHRLADSAEEYAGWESLASGACVESEVDSQERFLHFCRAVRALPLQCRRAFILKKVYELSQREIAEYLGISESTVEKHIARGMLDCFIYLEVRGLTSKSSDGRSRTRRARGQFNG